MRYRYMWGIMKWRLQRDMGLGGGGGGCKEEYLIMHPEGIVIKLRLTEMCTL